MPHTEPVYKRILLKLSGAALIANIKLGMDSDILVILAQQLRALTQLGVQVAIVVGGGNFFHGATLSKLGLDRISADQMGMLATMINALAMCDIFKRNGLASDIMSPIPLKGIIEEYNRYHAIAKLQSGNILILAGGTGNPLVTTDTAASLRAVEIKADLLLKATQVDGIFSADPHIHPTATLYKVLTYQQALDEKLGIMDLSAFCQCRDHNIKLRVFHMDKLHKLEHIILGSDEGTLVCNETGNHHARHT